METLTPVEQKIFDAWEEQIPGIKIETHIDLIRESMNKAAYHEAGHAAAEVFLEGKESNFRGINIIPTKDRLGVFMQLKTPYRFDDWPNRYGWIYGQWKIIGLLSGRMAEKRFDPDIQWIQDEVAFAIDPDYFSEDEQNEWRATDEGKAYDIAQQMEKRGWPWYRILNLMEQWTDEFLNIPVVWNVVENIAGRLIDAGEITDHDEYCSLIDPICHKWFNFPVWRRRFKVEVVKDAT